MTDAQGYQVTISTLRTESDLWYEQANRMGTIVGSVAGVRMDRVQGGPFQIVLAAYAQLCDAVSDRSREGFNSMAGIGEGLRTTAANYQAQEQQTTGNINAINGQGGVG